MQEGSRFYEMLAPVYDGLNADADYQIIQRFVASAAERCFADRKIRSVLDAGCGTGSLTVLLAEAYPDVTGADASESMLCMAQNKAFSAGRNIFFVHQELTGLELGREFDLAVCTMDTLNHLPAAGDVRAALKKIAAHLSPGGLFVFDLNTPYKHEKVLGNETIVKESDEAFCVWENEYNPADGSVRMEINLFCGDEERGYDRETACQTELLIGPDELSQALSEAGLSLFLVNDGYTQKPVGAQTQRFSCAARKQS